MHQFNTMIKSLMLITAALFLLSSCDKFGPNSRSGNEEDNLQSLYIIAKNGDSIRVGYHDNGKVASKITIKEKRKNGIAYAYYENGKVQYEIMYSDGFKHGITKWFYKSGRLYRETNYIKGMIDGVQKSYYENRKLKAEVPYKMGLLQIGTEEYTNTGKLLKEYPKIIVSPRNRLDIENIYYLDLELKPHQEKAKYFIFKKDKKTEGIIDLESLTLNGKATYPITIYPGSSLSEKIDIRVEFKTKKGNPKIISTIYKLAVENKN